MIRRMDSESIITIQMDLDTKASGLIINSMVRVSKFGPMVQFTRANLSEETNKERADSNGQMETRTTVSSKTTT